MIVSGEGTFNGTKHSIKKPSLHNSGFVGPPPVVWSGKNINPFDLDGNLQLLLFNLSKKEKVIQDR